MAPPLTETERTLLEDAYFKNKSVFGYGRDRVYKWLQAKYGDKLTISRRQVMDWLNSNELNQLFHDNKNKSKEVQTTRTTAPYKVVEIDLADMRSKEVNGYNWLLNGIDVFSKRAYSVPLKRKDDKLVLASLKILLKQMKQKPKTLRSDNGSEFINENVKTYLKSQKIRQVFGKAQQPQSQAQVERLNGILKRVIEQYKTQFDDSDWVKNIKQIVRSYNDTWQRTIDMSPLEAEKEENWETVRSKLYKKPRKKNERGIAKVFEVGDKVRLSQENIELSKSFRNYTREMYTIAKVFQPRSDSTLMATYQVKDADGDLIKEKLPHKLLLKVDKVNNPVKEPQKFRIRRIERPIRVKDGRQYKQYYEVAWVGYPKRSDNTLEPADVIQNDSPKAVQEYVRSKGEMQWSGTPVVNIRHINTWRNNLSSSTGAKGKKRGKSKGKNTTAS